MIYLITPIIHIIGLRFKYKVNKNNTMAKYTESMQFLHNAVNSESKAPYELRDRISYRKKVENDFAWAKAKADYFDGHSMMNFEQKRKAKEAYDLFHGKFDTAKYKNIANPFNLQAGDIANIEHIDIISLPIREIIGEEIKRPFSMMAAAINTDSLSEKRTKILNTYKQFVRDTIMQGIEQQLMQKHLMEQAQEEQQGQEQGMQPQMQQPQLNEQHQKAYEQEVEQNTPEKLKELLTEANKLPEETLAQHLINYLIKEQDLDIKFLKGWQDAIISAHEIYYITTVRNKPRVERVNPLNFFYIKSQQSEYIEDAEACVHERTLNIYEIYDEYSDYMTEKDRTKLEEIISGRNLTPQGLTMIESMGIKMIADVSNMQLIDTSLFKDDVPIKSLRFRVAHIVWKSMKKVIFLTTIDPENPEGEPIEVVVDENYKFDKDYDIAQVVAWVPEWWETTKVGTDLYLKMQPLEHQYRNIEDPYTVHGCYYGLTYDSNNSEPTSLLMRGVDWQVYYDIIWFRLKEAIAKDYGKVMIGLANQIPSDIGPEKWLYYLLTNKIGLVNPTAENMMGSDPQYWKSIDMSNTADISKYIDLLGFVEQRCLKAIGSNESRIGLQSVQETVSNNQQRLVQSSNVTEYFFLMHNRLKEKVCTALLEQAKLAYREKPPFVLTYIADELETVSFTVDPGKLGTAEYGVFLTNSAEDHQSIQALKSLVQPLIQNSQGDYRYVMEVLTAKNPASIKRLAELQHQEAVAMQQQAQQAQQEQLQQQLESQKQIQAEQQKWQAEQNQLDRDFRLKEAMIKGMGFAQDTDVNQNLIPDMLEISKFTHDAAIKQQEMSLRERELVENNVSEERDRMLKAKELQIKEKEADAKIKQANKPASKK